MCGARAKGFSGRTEAAVREMQFAAEQATGCDGFNARFVRLGAAVSLRRSAA